ncbi:MAG: glycosyltransferase [Candidatus Lokiarchaeota archaeon]|nr:glycosyltransferase [Candidatus Lokiarchaeota archaeon]
MHEKTVLILFLSNFNYDSRASNLYKSFCERGYEVKVVSFDWLTKGFKTESGEISVYKLHKGFLSLTFYLKFIFVLSFNLIKSKASIIFAEDVYTLPFAVIFSILKNGEVIYDSRELYGHLAGLRKRKIVQTILRVIEKIFIRGAYKIITTGNLDSEYIEKEFDLKDTIVIRNLPFIADIIEPFNFRKHFDLNGDVKILLYQGVILHGRGLRSIFEALNRINNCVLVILGDGEYREFYQNLANEKGLSNRVFFWGKVEQPKLLEYTAGADIGLTIIENLSLSYYYALPNKMFEYIQAGIPVLASNFPQMKEIIDRYKVGLYIDPENIDEIVDSLNILINNNELRNNLKSNCIIAAKELNWNKEINKLFDLISKDFK